MSYIRLNSLGKRNMMMIKLIKKKGDLNKFLVFLIIFCRILANNYIAFNEALKHFIRGKPIIPNEHRETWLDDLNRFIQTGEAIRTTLYTNFASNQYVLLFYSR